MTKGKIKSLFDRLVDYLSGDAIIKHGWDRQLGLFVYIFVLICLSIGWTLAAERRLVEVRNNERIIQELRISYQQRTLDVVGMNNRTKVDRMLKECNSSLTAPVTPPKRIVLEGKK